MLKRINIAFNLNPPPLVLSEELAATYPTVEKMTILAQPYLKSFPADAMKVEGTYWAALIPF